MADNKLSVLPGEYCREQVIYHIITRIRTAADILTDKMRMVILYGGPARQDNGNYYRGAIPEGTRILEKIECAVDILHCAEKFVGWPLTRIYEVESPAENIIGRYLVSSRRWIKAPYMVSLYLMLAKIPFEYYPLDKFSNIEELIKVIKTLPGGGIGFYARESVDDWKTLLLSYEKLFKKKKIDHYWSEEFLGGGKHYEGVHSLITGDCYSAGLSERYWKEKKRLEGESSVG
jgi:hypothetical protein